MKPIRALLITGGCCHDYPLQAQVLQDAAKKYGDVTWTVVNEGGKGTRGQIALYDNPDWAKPFDVVEVKTRIHNMLEVRLLYKAMEQTVEKRTAALRESEARFHAMREMAGFCAQVRRTSKS